MHAVVSFLLVVATTISTVMWTHASKAATLPSCDDSDSHHLGGSSLDNLERMATPPTISCAMSNTQLKHTTFPAVGVREYKYMHLTLNNNTAYSNDNMPLPRRERRASWPAAPQLSNRGPSQAMRTVMAIYRGPGAGSPPSNRHATPPLQMT